MITTDQFTYLVKDIPTTDAKTFMKALLDTYGIQELIPDDATSLCTSWYVYFTNPNTELVFKLKYSDML
jgi:hypothetical protein